MVMPERMFRVAASVATKTVAGGRAKVFHRCNHRPTGFTGERRRPGRPGGDFPLALKTKFAIAEQSFMRHVRILAVQCGASHVAYGLFSGGPGSLVLERFATQPVGASHPTEDDWLESVGAALRELLRGERLHGGCVVGLPGHLTFNRLFRIPAVSPRQRRKIIAFEQRQGTAAAEEMVGSHVVLAQDEAGRDIMLAVAKRRLVENLGVRIRENGLYPEAVLPAWLVLRYAIGYRFAGPAGALVLSVGARSSQLVSAGASGFSACTLAVGGNTVTQKVAEELELDPTAAEALKLRGFADTAERPVGARERVAGQKAIDQFVRRLCAEILRLPPFLPSAKDAARPAVLWLTGGGARLQELPAALEEKLQLRVERWDLRSHLGLGRTATDLGLGPDDVPLVDLIGLAAGAARGARSEGNLLPRPFRREMFVRRRWPWLAISALIVIVAGLVPIWRLRVKAREARRQIAEVESTLSVFRQAEAQNRSSLARLADINRRIAALRKLARGRSGWMALLGELQGRLASEQDVWLDRLQVLAPDSRESSGEPAATPARSDVNPPAGSAGPIEAATGIRLLVAGRLFDAGRLTAGAGDESPLKVESLLGALRLSPLVAAVEHEHFAASQPGFFDFEITLRLAPDALF